MQPTGFSIGEPVSGFGSVTGVPLLPNGFTNTFKSSLVDIGAVRLHAVIGGQGPALLLLGGWPQNWFAWRALMLPLAERFTVIAVDPRGVGLSDKPDDGYDADTLSADMFALMDALGHERFAMVGHDIGMWTGYAMAADRPERIARIALGEAIIPGLSPSPPLISDDRRTSDFLWHFNFNRALDVNEALVRGREAIYFGYQFATKAGSPEALPAAARDFYIEQMRRDPKALRASFEYYRAIDASIPQYRRRMARRIELPVLAFSGALACGDMVEQELRSVADDVQSVIIPDSGHYPAEEQPEALLAALQAFLTLYA
ncbi:alpha/beta hydrolase [Gluconobacter cerinus]|uniref:alpha/beta fold hydrolase n=1 Tax=Gluconobacter cerinus TaxID=38307 RepID=UPI001B8C104C|nr:alpha/beta hydrolase [Gluconobacter cerinus]MBS1032909.1 alpha/beta hydrolase [Gluconobacter cerinus]